MSDGGIFKAEVVYIRDSEDGGAGEVVQQETYTATQVSAWVKYHDLYLNIATLS